MWRLMLLAMIAAFIYADYSYVSGKITSGGAAPIALTNAPCEHYSNAGTAPCFDGSEKPMDFNAIDGLNQRQPVIDGAPTAGGADSNDPPQPVSAGN